jgi:hypothetical protein
MDKKEKEKLLKEIDEAIRNMINPEHMINEIIRIIKERH